MQSDKAVSGIDRIVICIALVISEGLHEKRLGGPLGIGMLALNLGKTLGR
jgi:hypothetical protein